MRSFFVLGAAVLSTLSTLVRQATAHPLCYYDDKPTDPDQVMLFCPEQADGACCNDLEEMAAVNVFNTAFSNTPEEEQTEECRDYFRQVACGPCNSYSAHLYEVLGSELGPEDGMTMKNSFCQELVEVCAGQIDFPTYDGESYCEIHTLGSSTDAYWSYPLDPDELSFTSSGLVEAFPDLPQNALPSELITMHMTPDGEEWWLGGQNGQIVKIPAEDATSSTLVLDLSSGADLHVAFEEGLLDFAFSPAFNSNNYFYVSYSIEDTGGVKNRLGRFTYSSTVAATLASVDIILTSKLKATSIHSAGWVGFKPSDYANPSGSFHDIYWTIGDGGPQEDPDNTGQDTSNILASVVRVSVPSGTSASDVGYTIPSGNYPGEREEICAPGFRNPFRCGFDSANDDLFCGDVGHTKVEEIDIVECGENYGWSRFEGSRCQEAAEDRLGDCDGAARSGFTFPIYEFCHNDYFSSDEEEDEFTNGVEICGARSITGFAVIGGYVYHGQRFSDVLEGAYLFADSQKKNIYYLTQEEGEWTPGVIIGDGTAAVISFSEDNNGEIYVITAERLPYQLPCGNLCSTTCLDQADAAPTYTLLGCFADVNTDRALQLQKSPGCPDGEDAMSPAICASYCETIEDAYYFGVQFANECFCGAVDEDFARHGVLNELACNFLCTGNTENTCGGRNAIEVYEFETAPTPCVVPSPVPPTPLPPTPLPPVFTPSSPTCTLPTPAPEPLVDPTPAPSTPMPAIPFLGCFGDDKTSRVLSGQSTKSSSMTTAFCAAFCEGSQLLGTQFTNECFCSAPGDEYDEYGTATCNFPCAGDASQTCGGRDAISIYEYDGTTTTQPTTPPTPSPLPISPPTYTAVGCFVDSKSSRLLSATSISTTLMTTEVCESFCAAFTYFGTEFGKECFCGSPSSLGLEAPNCDTACAGDSSQICGGFDAINVYEYTEITDSEYNFLGCYTDSRSNRVMGSKSVDSSMTTALCASNCASYSFFGTQFGNECFCSNDSDFDQLGESDACTKACTGDSAEICGGFLALSVYSK